MASDDPAQEPRAQLQVIAPIDSEVAVRNAIYLWVEQSTRPETFDRRDKLRE